MITGKTQAFILDAKKIKMMKRLVFCLFFLGIISCQQKNTVPERIYPGSEPPSTKYLGEITIVYGYQDASVPPEDHRSYTIYLTNKNYRFVVDSYGEIIKDTTLVLANQKEKVKQVLTAFKKHKIKNMEEQVDDIGCTGGNGEFIKITKEGERFFNGSNYYCGGKTIGNLTGDVKGFLKELKAQVDAKVFLYN